jgi:hypothetical protein
LIQAALLGGLFIGVLSTLPVISLGNCCCLWLISGGALAAWLQQQNQPRAVGPARGALVGLLAGVVGAFVWLAGAMFFDAVMGPMIEGALERAIDATPDMPPEVREAFEMFGDRDNPFRYAIGFAFQFFAGAIFSTLGGLLAGLFLARDVPPALGGPPPPIPPQM